jgi:hypothetical protein
MAPVTALGPLSKRGAARALGIRPATVPLLIRRQLLTEIPWGSTMRIPRADVERLAREGWTLAGPAPRRRAVRRHGTCDAAAIRALDIESLRRAP